jgi:RNA polymerase sigma-70 factor (sigma-E family)
LDPADDFRRFFDQQFGRLRHLGFLLTGSWDEGEELAQDALVGTLAAWARLGDQAHAGAYARTVLVNRHRSLLRRSLVRARRQRAGPGGAHGQVAPPGTEQRLVVLEALGRLSDAQRAVLVLRFWEDLSEAEVCRLLGLPAGTVKSHTRRGLARLRQDLAPQPGGADAFEVAR